MAGAPAHAGTEPVISVRDVVVSYNGRRVLDGINLDISRGETMALLGGSGSGKSTRCAVISQKHPLTSNNRRGRSAIRPDSGERCRSRELQTGGSKEAAAFDWSSVSECSVIQFHVCRRQYRPTPAGAHPTGRIDDLFNDLDEACGGRVGGIRKAQPAGASRGNEEARCR